MNDFAEILRLVTEDSALASALAGEPDEASLFAAVIALGRTHGLDVAPAVLQEVTRANRRLWIERWLTADGIN